MSAAGGFTEEELGRVFLAALDCKRAGIDPAALLTRVANAEKYFLESDPQAGLDIPPLVAKVIARYRRIPGGAPSDEMRNEEAIRTRVRFLTGLLASTLTAAPPADPDIVVSPSFQQEYRSLFGWVSLQVLDPFVIVDALNEAFGWKRAKGRPPDEYQARRDASRYRDFLYLRQIVDSGQRHTPVDCLDEATILKSLATQSVPEDLRPRLARELAAYRHSRISKSIARASDPAMAARLTLAQRCALWFLEQTEATPVLAGDLPRAMSLIDRLRKAWTAARKQSAI